MKKDYSEYKLSPFERYNYFRSDSKYAKLSYFKNRVRFFPDSRSIKISVDPFKEYVHFYDDIIEDEKRHNNGVPYSTVENDSEREIRLEQIAKNELYYESFCKRFEIDNSKSVEDQENFYESNPDETEEPLNNVLSGCDIKIYYGEGILDFIYADFKEAYSEAIFVPRILIENRDAIKEILGTESDKDTEESETTKIYSSWQEALYEYYRYVSTRVYVEEMSYQSLYTAICPPVFSSDYDSVEALKWYYKYLLTLQKEYLELLEFCFDESFYPEVLGRLHPAERYVLYRRLHHYPAVTERTEEVFFTFHHMSGTKMPYGTSAEEVIKRLYSEIPNDEIHREFASRYGISSSELGTMLSVPSFLNITYKFKSVAEILELEFGKMLEEDIRFIKCQRCGKYFIRKGNYEARYCDRIADGETRSCRELAAQENYRQKNIGNKALPIYSKYYKRYAARVKVKQISEEDFKKWKYAALAKRDDCSDGKITPEEYIEWMEGCFPNRRKATDK